MGVKTLHAYLASGEVIPYHGQPPHLSRVSKRIPGGLIYAPGILLLEPYGKSKP